MDHRKIGLAANNALRARAYVYVYNTEWQNQFITLDEHNTRFNKASSDTSQQHDHSIRMKNRHLE